MIDESSLRGGLWKSRVYLTTDGIKANDNLQMTINNNDCYDIQGRSTQQPSNGIYIKNGKKILVK